MTEARTPNLNQKSRLFDPPRSKTEISETKSTVDPISRTSSSQKVEVKALSSSSAPNLAQKSRLFSSPASKTAPVSTASPKASADVRNSVSKASSSVPKPVSKPEQSVPVKKSTPFSRIVICYCCGQGFSIHSVVKHYTKCRERRPANYKSLPKEATCPEMPEPNKLPVPGESSTAADFQAFNDEAFQIYKAHLVKCPWGCDRTTEPDRMGVHMRGCSLRPKPPPKSEGEVEAGDVVPEPTEADDVVPEPTGVADDVPESTEVDDVVPEPTGVADGVPEPTEVDAVLEPEQLDPS